MSSVDLRSNVVSSHSESVTSQDGGGRGLELLSKGSVTDSNKGCSRGNESQKEDSSLNPAVKLNCPLLRQ